MKLDLYQRVIVTKNFPDQHLKAGDILMLVDYWRDPNGGEDGAILELPYTVGVPLDITVVPESAIEVLPEEIV